jgi:mRNA interferase MazF
MATNDTSSGPKRGEIWRVNLEPVMGSEMDKTRPAVVISSDAVGVLPVRLVVPVTSWKSWYEGQIWHIRLRPTEQSGLSTASAADALQIRGVDTSRFVHRMGRIARTDLENIIAAVAAVIEYE